MVELKILIDFESAASAIYVTEACRYQNRHKFPGAYRFTEVKLDFGKIQSRMCAIMLVRSITLPLARERK